MNKKDIFDYIETIKKDYNKIEDYNNIKIENTKLKRANREMAETLKQQRKQLIFLTKYNEEIEKKFGIFICPFCGGAGGHENEYGGEECRDCGGSGRIDEAGKKRFDELQKKGKKRNKTECPF